MIVSICIKFGAFISFPFIVIVQKDISVIDDNENPIIVGSVFIFLIIFFTISFY